MHGRTRTPSAASRHLSRRGSGAVSVGSAAIALMLLAAVVALILLLDVPSRVAALGEGSLDRVVRPTTEATYGDVVRLEGRSGRSPLLVTARAPRPVRSDTPGVSASRGNRLLGVPVVLQGAGQLAWSSRQGLESSLVDEAGTSYRSSGRVARIRGARVLIGDLSLRPGQSVRRVLVFEVPRRARVERFRLTVGRGLTRTGDWSAQPHQR